MTEVLHLHLTASQASLRLESLWPWQRRVRDLPAHSWDARVPATLDLPDLPAPFLPAIGPLRRRLRVYLGASVCRLLLAAMPPEAVSPAERQAIAMALLARELGLAPADWTCTVDRADGHAANSVICAMPLALLAQLRALAARHGLVLESVRPLAGVLWNVANTDAQWPATQPRALLVVEDDALVSLAASDARMLSALVFPHRGEALVLERELHRLAHGPQAGVDTRILVAPARRDMALGHPQLQLRLASGQTRFGDFRDMYFAQSAEAGA